MFSHPGQTAAGGAAGEAAVGADVSDADWAACAGAAEVAWPCSPAVNGGAGDADAVTAVDDDIAGGERFGMTPLSAG